MSIDLTVMTSKEPPSTDLEVSGVMKVLADGIAYIHRSRLSSGVVKDGNKIMTPGTSD